jgi:peptidoglycan hydrolase CwlO-like protein
MIKQNLELAKVTEEQKENETALAQLTENIEKQQKDMEDLKSKKSYSDYELQELTNRKALLQADFDKRLKEEQDRIQPELQRLEAHAEDLKQEIENKTKEIDKKKQLITELEKARDAADRSLEQKKEENEKLVEDYITAQQKPVA